VTDYSHLFEAERFQAPEGTLTAKVKGVNPAGDRVGLLLWFYDQTGVPLDDNLTITLSTESLSSDSGGEYRRRILSEVRNWLTGVRDGEPVQVLE
jgi:hypothetical protein